MSVTSLIRIVRSRVRSGVRCYEVEWEAHSAKLIGRHNNQPLSLILSISVKITCIISRCGFIVSC